MDNLDLVKVYTPEGDLKRIERKYLSKALESGFRQAEEVQPATTPKRESAVADLITGGVKGIASLGKSALQTGAETAEDVLRLGTQGVSMGFADEAVAGGKAATESLIDGKESFSDLYQRYLASEQEKIKSSRERSPYLGTAAEFGGAVLPAIAAATFTGGAAAPAAGAGLARIIGGGALSGAIAGAGTSEGTLIGNVRHDKDKGLVIGEKAKQLLGDIAAGGASGAILAPAITGVSKVLSKAAGATKNLIDESIGMFDEASEAKFIFDRAKGGDQFFTKQAQQAFRNEKQDAVNKITSAIGSVDEALGNSVNEVINSSTASGLRINANPIIGDLDNVLNRTSSKDIKNVINTIKQSSDGTPAELYALYKRVKDELGSNITSDERSALRALQTSLKNELDNNIVDANGNKIFKDAAQLFHDFRSATGERIFSGGKKLTVDLQDPRNPLSVKGKRIGVHGADKADYLRSVQSGIENLFEETGKTGGKIGEAYTILDSVTNGLDEFEKANGSKFSNLLGTDLDSFFKMQNLSVAGMKPELEHQATKMSAYQKLYGYDKDRGKSIGLAAQITPKFLERQYKLPMAAGRIAGAYEKAAGSKLFSLPKEGLLKVADSIKNDFPNHAKALTDALDNSDLYKKNAILFALMQNPNFRNMAPALLNDTGESIQAEGELENE